MSHNEPFGMELFPKLRPMPLKNTKRLKKRQCKKNLIEDKNYLSPQKPTNRSSSNKVDRIVQKLQNASTPWQTSRKILDRS